MFADLFYIILIVSVLFTGWFVYIVVADTIRDLRSTGTTPSLSQLSFWFQLKKSFWYHFPK